MDVMELGAIGELVGGVVVVTEPVFLVSNSRRSSPR